MDEVCERSMDSKNRRHTEVLVIQLKQNKAKQSKAKQSKQSKLKQSKAKQIKANHLETDSNMFY